MKIKVLKEKHLNKFKRLERAYKNQGGSDLYMSNWGERTLKEMRQVFSEKAYKNAGDVYVTIDKIINELD